MNLRLAATAAAATAAALLGTTSFAEDAEPQYPEFSVDFGATVNDGNTEDESANLGAEFKHVSDGYEYLLGANGTITRTTKETTTIAADGTSKTRKDKETTAKNGEIKGKVLIPVADPFSAYIDASLFSDEIADVDYRAIVGPGIAWNVYKTDTFVFALELGVSPMWEKIDGEKEYYTMLRAGQKMEKTFEKGAKIFETVEYLPALNDSDKYLVNGEAGVESPLSDRLSLRVVFRDKYNSLPGDDNEKNDISLNVGVRVKL